VPCLAKYGRWDFFGIRVGCIKSDKVFVCYIWIFILSPLSVCLWSPFNWQEIRCINQRNILLIQLLVLLHRHLTSSSVNNEPICWFLIGQLTMVYTWLLWTWTASLIYQNVPSQLKFLLEYEPQNSHLSDGNLFFHLAFKVFWCQASASHGKLWVFHFVPCFLGSSQLEYHFFCRVLLIDSLSNDLLPLSESFLNGPLLWVVWAIARTWDVTTTLGRYSKV
jgi:hypothetical protein